MMLIFLGYVILFVLFIFLFQFILKLARKSEKDTLENLDEKYKPRKP